MPLLTKKWFNFIVGAVLIDGRNRLRACLELAIETKLQPFQEENEPDPGRYILAINLERRHLTEEHFGYICTQIPYHLRSNKTTLRRHESHLVDSGRRFRTAKKSRPQGRRKGT